MIIFLYTAYFVIGLFLASKYVKKVEEAERHQDIDKTMVIMSMTFIVALWPLYLLYKLFFN